MRRRIKYTVYPLNYNHETDKYLVTPSMRKVKSFALKQNGARVIKNICQPSNVQGGISYWNCEDEYELTVYGDAK